MNELLDYIKSYISISEATEKSIKQCAHELTLERGALIAEEGKTCKTIYFLVSGAARTYLYLKGKDITHWIYLENSLITSWHSYLLKKPSKEYIELTEDAKVVAISYEDWHKLYDEFPEMNKFSRLILEEQLAVLDDFYKGYYFLSAKEKYELLISWYPEITQRVNLGYIASMLGISQETLSRIRGK